MAHPGDTRWVSPQRGQQQQQAAWTIHPPSGARPSSPFGGASSVGYSVPAAPPSGYSAHPPPLPKDLRPSPQRAIAYRSIAAGSSPFGTVASNPPPSAHPPAVIPPAGSTPHGLKVYSGYLTGPNILGSPVEMTIHDAQAKALADPRIKGFMYCARRDPSSDRVWVYFKPTFEFTPCEGWHAVHVHHPENAELPPTSPTGERGDAARPTTFAHHRDRIVRFYQEYCPEKLPTAVLTLKEYKGMEDALFASLVRCYGPEPPYVPLHEYLPDGWACVENTQGHVFYMHANGGQQWIKPGIDDPPPPPHATLTPAPGGQPNVQQGARLNDMLALPHPGHSTPQRERDLRDWRAERSAMDAELPAVTGDRAAVIGAPADDLQHDLTLWLGQNGYKHQMVLSDRTREMCISRENVLRALRWLTNNVGPHDRLFLYYTGGLSDRGMHCLGDRVVTRTEVGKMLKGAGMAPTTQVTIVMDTEPASHLLLNLPHQVNNLAQDTNVLHTPLSHDTYDASITLYEITKSPRSHLGAVTRGFLDAHRAERADPEDVIACIRHHVDAQGSRLNTGDWESEYAPHKPPRSAGTHTPGGYDPRLVSATLSTGTVPPVDTQCCITVASTAPFVPGKDLHQDSDLPFTKVDSAFQPMHPAHRPPSACHGRISPTRDPPPISQVPPSLPMVSRPGSPPVSGRPMAANWERPPRDSSGASHWEVLPPEPPGVAMGRRMPSVPGPYDTQPPSLRSPRGDRPGAWGREPSEPMPYPSHTLPPSQPLSQYPPPSQPPHSEFPPPSRYPLQSQYAPPSHPAPPPPQSEAPPPSRYPPQAQNPPPSQLPPQFQPPAPYPTVNFPVSIPGSPHPPAQGPAPSHPAASQPPSHFPPSQYPMQSDFPPSKPASPQQPPSSQPSQAAYQPPVDAVSAYRPPQSVQAHAQGPAPMPTASSHYKDDQVEQMAMPGMQLSPRSGGAPKSLPPFQPPSAPHEALQQPPSGVELTPAQPADAASAPDLRTVSPKARRQTLDRADTEPVDHHLDPGTPDTEDFVSAHAPGPAVSAMPSAKGIDTMHNVQSVNVDSVPPAAKAPAKELEEVLAAAVAAATEAAAQYFTNRAQKETETARAAQPTDKMVTPIRGTSPPPPPPAAGAPPSSSKPFSMRPSSPQKLDSQFGVLQPTSYHSPQSRPEVQSAGSPKAAAAMRSQAMPSEGGVQSPWQAKAPAAVPSQWPSQAAGAWEQSAPPGPVPPSQSTQQPPVQGLSHATMDPSPVTHPSEPSPPRGPMSVSWAPVDGLAEADGISDLSKTVTSHPAELTGTGTLPSKDASLGPRASHPLGQSDPGPFASAPQPFFNQPGSFPGPAAQQQATSFPSPPMRVGSPPPSMMPTSPHQAVPAPSGQSPRPVHMQQPSQTQTQPPSGLQPMSPPQSQHLTSHTQSPVSLAHPWSTQPLMPAPQSQHTVAGHQPLLPASQGAPTLGFASPTPSQAMQSQGPPKDSLMLSAPSASMHQSGAGVRSSSEMTDVVKPTPLPSRHGQQSHSVGISGGRGQQRVSPQRGRGEGRGGGEAVAAAQSSPQQQPQHQDPAATWGGEYPASRRMSPPRRTREGGAQAQSSPIGPGGSVRSPSVTTSLTAAATAKPNSSPGTAHPRSQDATNWTLLPGGPGAGDGAGQPPPQQPLGKPPLAGSFRQCPPNSPVYGQRPHLNTQLSQQSQSQSASGAA